MKFKKLKNGYYSAVISLGFDENGKRKQKRISAPSKWELQKLIEEIQANRTNVNSREMTVHQAMAEYVASRESVIEPTTLRTYHYIVDFRLKSIHDIKIKQLQIVDIQKAINQETRLGLSRRTIKAGVDLLKSALDLYDILLNFKKLKLPKAVKSKDDLPELDAIFQALEGTSIETYCILALNGCLRVGEVLGLKFADIDSESDSIYIHRTQLATEKGVIYRDYCKTDKSMRTIRISPELCEKIKNLPHNSEDDFVVPLTYKALYNRYYRIMKKNGLPTKFHTIRKLSASTLHAAGMPDKYILAMGGWSTDNILKSVYEKTFESEREKATQKAVECFSEVNKRLSQNQQNNAV